MTTRPRIVSPIQHAIIQSRHSASVQRPPAPASGPRSRSPAREYAEDPERLERRHPPTDGGGALAGDVAAQDGGVEGEGGARLEAPPAGAAAQRLVELRRRRPPRGHRRLGEQQAQQDDASAVSPQNTSTRPRLSGPTTSSLRMTAPSGNVNCWSAPISLMTLYSLRGSLMPFALSASMFRSKIGATFSTSRAPGRSGSTTTKPTQGTVWAIGAARTRSALDRVSQVHAPSASLGMFLPSKTSPKAASDWPVAFGDTKGPRGGPAFLSSSTRRGDGVQLHAVDAPPPTQRQQ